MTQDAHICDYEFCMSGLPCPASASSKFFKEIFKTNVMNITKGYRLLILSSFFDYHIYIISLNITYITNVKIFLWTYSIKMPYYSENSLTIKYSKICEIMNKVAFEMMSQYANWKFKLFRDVFISRRKTFVF